MISAGVGAAAQQLRDGGGSPVQELFRLSVGRSLSIGVDIEEVLSPRNPSRSLKIDADGTVVVVIARRVDVVDEHQPVPRVQQQPLPAGLPRDEHALAQQRDVRCGGARLVQYVGGGAARLARSPLRAAGSRRSSRCRRSTGGGVASVEMFPVVMSTTAIWKVLLAGISEGGDETATVPRPGWLGDDVVGAQLAHEFAVRLEEPQAVRSRGAAIRPPRPERSSVGTVIGLGPLGRAPFAGAGSGGATSSTDGGVRPDVPQRRIRRGLGRPVGRGRH